MIDNKKYTFYITPINIDELLEQVSFALEKRMELISRGKYPKIWYLTDMLNEKEKASEIALKKRRVFRKIISAINLVLGIILFVPGIMNIKQAFFLCIFGFCGIMIGVIGLLGKRNSNKNKFIKSAKQLLQGKEQVIVGENKIIFTENQMELKTGNNNELIQYSNFEYIIETEDAFLLTYQGYVTVLQKKDLHENGIQDFCDFISFKVKLISLCN